MNFHTTDKLARGSLNDKSKVVNVYSVTRESVPSYFTSQWKLLEIDLPPEN